MDAFVTTLTTALTPAAIWDSIEPAAPLVVIMLGVSIGYYVLRRVIGKTGKLKAGV